MSSDKNNSGYITADTATTTSVEQPHSKIPSPAFKVPTTTMSQPQQQQQPPQQQQTIINKPTPPSTPPHDTNYRSSQSPPPPSSNMPHQQQQQQSSFKVQGRRLSIDRLLPMLVPKTPDQQNLNNGFDNTPLQSPTKTPRSVKRRSTDIYNLLKTPDHKIRRSSHGHFDDDYDDDEIDDEMIDGKTSRQAKRSSLELYKLLNNDDNKVKLVQLSPKKSSSTTVFNDQNATSPVKNSYRVKKSDTEIKELSNNLKSRLNYAFLKVQHGWTEKPLAELEKSPLKPSMMVSSPPRETIRPRPRSLNLQSPHSNSTSTFTNTNRVRLDDFASSRHHRSSHANANVALITALSPRQSIKHETDPEKTAAMSLMKLSSPIKSNATINYPSAHTSPTRLVTLEKPLSSNTETHIHHHQQQQEGKEDVEEEEEAEEEEEDNKTETDVDEDDIVMTNEKTDDEISE